MTTYLRVDASARNAGSVSRALGDYFFKDIDADNIHVRDVSRGLPFVTEEWVTANFTPAEDRRESQKTRLAQSDALICELRNADIIVITTPIYNFGVPASLKAWIDLVCRARETFRYTADGVEGLLSGKRAVILAASGGTPLGGDIDFATPYLKHVMGFIGISDVTIIGAERLTRNPDSQERAQAQIDAIRTGFS